jgi:F-box and WD-40 domain protein CDC4
MDSHRASFSDLGEGNAHTAEQLDPHSQPSRDSATSFTSTPSRSLSTKKTVTPLPANLLPSAPASPPTPAPSPTPHQRPPNWHSTDDEESSFLLNLRIQFSTLSNARKQKLLEGLLDVCDSQQLSFVSSYVGPRLRKDPFQVFPNELCLRVCYVIDFAVIPIQR